MIARPSFIREDDWRWMIKVCPQFAGLLAAIGWHETKWGSIGAGKDGFILGVGVYTKGKPNSRYLGLEHQIKWACRKLRAWFATREYELGAFQDFGRNIWSPGYYDASEQFINTGEKWATVIWKHRDAIVYHKGIAATTQARDVIHSREGA